ncbi:alpha/beta fold hydrolase [Enterococcus sp. LJL90]
MPSKKIHLMIDDIPAFEVVEEALQEAELPLIIYYHGWQTNKNLAMTQARRLAGLGFRVCLPDAPNHGERHQPVSTVPSLTFWETIHGNLFEFEKIRDFFLKNRPNNGRLGVGGFSMGGMTTAALLTHHPEIDAAVCLMGTPSPKAFVDTTIMRRKEANIFLPSDYRDLMSWTPAYDLSAHPETLNGRPLFFWHGTEDWKIPIDSVVKFVDENRNTEAGRNISLHIGVGEGHLLKIPTMEKASFFLKEMLIDRD